MASSNSKQSGGKLALHSDLRARARLGGAVVAEKEGTMSLQSMSARRGGTAAQVVDQRGRPTSRPASANPRQTLCHTAVGRASSPASTTERPNEVCCSCVATYIGNYEKELARNRARGPSRDPADGPTNDAATRTATARKDLDASHTAPNAAMNKPQQAAPKMNPKTAPTAPESRNAKSNNQNNATEHATFSGGDRENTAARRREAPRYPVIAGTVHAGKLGACGTVRGLGAGVDVATARSQYPWAAVAVSNPNFEMLFLSQFSTVPVWKC